MAKLVYNNREYEETIKEMIQDAFYSRDTSYTLRITAIRRLTEIFLRRLLLLPVSDEITIGDPEIRKLLKENGKMTPYLQRTLKKMCRATNPWAHTKKRNKATKEEFDYAVEILFDLFAYLFYDFFQEYKFGSNSAIVSEFSHLPPIIRLKTLMELYEQNQDDDEIIEKLINAMVKATDTKQTLQWIEDNKKHLISIEREMPEDKKELIIRDLAPLVGIEQANIFVANQHVNMYDMGKEDAIRLGKTLDATGRLYTNFEEAVDYYSGEKRLKGEAVDIQKFNSLMEFVFIGRVNQARRIQNIDEQKYIINQIMNLDNIDEFF